MSLIETNFIRPQEVYDRNTGESKVRYRSYDGNDRFIPVVEGEKGVPKTMVEVTHAELKAMRDGGKLTAGSLYRITDYNCTTTQENTQSAGHQFDIVLLALSKDKLAEEGWAMMHNNIYDVTFKKKKKNGVTKKCYLYCTNEEDKEYNIVDAVTLLGDSNFDLGGTIISIDEENKKVIVDSTSSILTNPDIPYNYFQNSNLSAWKVWYCLDNDKDRFAWADDSVDEDSPESITEEGADNIFVRDYTKDQEKEGTTYYGWYDSDNNSPRFTTSQEPNVGDTIYIKIKSTFRVGSTISSYTPAHEGTNLPNGRGVIYRLIDEFNNDIKYDFKNIQFKRKITNGQYDANGTETWCYTLNVWYNDMCQDASIVGNTLQNDEGYVTGVYDNIFGYTTAYDLSIEGVNTFAFALGNNVVLSYEDDGYIGISSNTIGSAFSGNTIGNNFNSNTIGIDFSSNTIGIDFSSNTIGSAFSGNTIGDNFSGNTIGNNFNSNTIGNDFYSNMIGNFFNGKTIGDNTSTKNYGNNGVELATKS